MVKDTFSVQLVAFLSSFSGFTAYGLILGVLLACGLGLPIPEDITLVAAGILAGLGNISLTGALLAVFFGVLMGDCILFFLGRFYGARVFSLPGFRSVFTEDRINKAREKVLANSKMICFTARFLPGLRAPTYLTAGMLGVSPIVFILLDGFAALISVPIWIFVGFYLGENLEKTIHLVSQIQVYLVSGIALSIFIYLIFRSERKRRRRRESVAPSEADLE